MFLNLSVDPVAIDYPACKNLCPFVRMIQIDNNRNLFLMKTLIHENLILSNQIAAFARNNSILRDKIERLEKEP